YRRAQDIDAGQDRSEVIRRPTHESEDATGSERQDTSIAVEDLFRNGMTKPNAVLDTFFGRQKFDSGQPDRSVVRWMTCGRVGCLSHHESAPFFSCIRNRSVPLRRQYRAVAGIAG